jgi:ribonuclease BN (tRNA processing enzyme)
MVSTEADTALEAVMLGSGGWMATPQRATSSILVTRPEHTSPVALLLDAGTGVVHLARDPTLLGGAERLVVLLTHFHLDHAAGLTYLPALAPHCAIEIWAPGQLLSGVPSRTILERLVGAPYLSVPLQEFTTAMEEIHEGEMALGSLRIRCRRQELHPGGSVGLRVGDDLVYVTDTAPDPLTVDFARAARVLVHEAWTPDEPSHEHSSAAWAGKVAEQAEVGRLVLSHIHPLRDDPEALVAAATKSFDNSVAGHDLLRLL